MIRKQRLDIMYHQIKNMLDGGTGQKFEVEVETGEILEAELLAVLEVEGREYAVYTLPNEEGGTDVLASYVVQDEEGFDKLIDIDNQSDKVKITKVITDMAAGKLL